MQKQNPSQPVDDASDLSKPEAVAQPNPKAADPKTTSHRPEHQYDRTLDSILREADEAGAMSEFVGSLTWTLARIASHYGRLYIVGDIVRRFGNDLCFLEDRKTAAADAEKAKASGQQPH